MKVEVGRGMNLKNIGNGARRQFTNTNEALVFHGISNVKRYINISQDDVNIIVTNHVETAWVFS